MFHQPELYARSGNIARWEGQVWSSWCDFVGINGGFNFTMDQPVDRLFFWVEREVYIFAARVEKPWIVDDVSSGIRSGWYTEPFSPGMFGVYFHVQIRQSL